MTGVQTCALPIWNELAVWPLPVEQGNSVFVRSDLDQFFGQHFYHDITPSALAIGVGDLDRQRSPTCAAWRAPKNGFRGRATRAARYRHLDARGQCPFDDLPRERRDRKSTRLNSSHW